jgi:hypothetical protein
VIGPELARSVLAPVSRDELLDVLPLVRRAADLDPDALVRLRCRDERFSAFVRLPFAVLAGRTIPTTSTGLVLDRTLQAAQLVAWLDDDTRPVPQARDDAWRGTVPPAAHWHRIDVVPDAVVREVVRSGARTLEQAVARHGVQPRAQVADGLLDSQVLTVSDDHERAQITLRMLSAVVRLGFLPPGSHIGVDVQGRWTRVAAQYGSVYAERPGLGLSLL